MTGTAAAPRVVVRDVSRDHAPACDPTIEEHR